MLLIYFILSLRDKLMFRPFPIKSKCVDIYPSFDVKCVCLNHVKHQVKRILARIEPGSIREHNNAEVNI